MKQKPTRHPEYRSQRASEGGAGADAAALPSLESVAARAAGALRQAGGEVLSPGLYLVATPIGNLADISLRALATLARADVIYCEDTRHSRTLLSHYAISRPLQPYHEHNAAEQRPRILSALEEGKRIALMSDAGTPLVSDPGYKLAREAAAAGHAVTALPGATAPVVALTLSGLPADTFLFAGFLPTRAGARQTRLKELAAVPATLVFFEAPSRIAQSLADMTAVLGARAAAVARELTKLHEEIVRAPLPELAAAFADRETKGEIVVLVGPPVAVEATEGAIRERLQPLLHDMSLRDAAKAVADFLGVPKSRVYDLGLAMKREPK